MTEDPKQTHQEKHVSVFAEELQQMMGVLQSIIPKYQAIGGDYHSKGAYAHFHLRGLIYHLKRMKASYDEIGYELHSRIQSLGSGPTFIMYTPAMQELLYEFYAFINLSRISLDNLKYIVYPLFLGDPLHMPKSITDLGRGKTNCGIYERIAATEELAYLIQLRNCLVHFRTLAVNDNSVIRHEASKEMNVEGTQAWFAPMAKAVYRLNENKDMVFNIFLPDKIFEGENNKTVAKFTYTRKLNILAESMRFMRHILFNYMDSFSESIFSTEKRYTYDKKGKMAPVDYLGYTC